MSIAKRVSVYFVKQGIIAEEDAPIYQYGLEQLLFQSLNLVVAIAIGVCMGRWVECILFLAAYIPLRKYAGGWHASTQFRCFWLSTALIAVALFTIGMIPLTGLSVILLLAPSTMVIAILAPVADTNKPLSRNEYRVYGRRARIILVVLVAIALIFYFLDFLNIAICIGTAISTLSIMLILGFIKNKGKRMIEEHPEGDG